MLAARFRYNERRVVSMTNTNIRMITYGAMAVGATGLCALVNLISGGAVDILFSYALSVMMVVYSRRFGAINGMVTTIAALVVLLMAGLMFFAFYTFLTMQLGVLLAALDHRNWRYGRRVMAITLAGALKNILIFNFMAGLLGLDMRQETYALMESFNIGFQLMNIVYWTTPVVIALMESIILNNYARMVLIKIDRYHQRGR